jgi:polyisoprenoid-binding protein YceI
VKWAVEPGSTLGFATAWSGAPIEGRFDRWTADIVFSPDALERSRIVVTIDVGSVNTGDKAQASGTASLDRTAFSIGEGEFAATDQIPGKVTIKVAVRAHRAG